MRKTYFSTCRIFFKNVSFFLINNQSRNESSAPYLILFLSLFLFCFLPLFLSACIGPYRNMAFNLLSYHTACGSKSLALIFKQVLCQCEMKAEGSDVQIHSQGKISSAISSGFTTMLLNKNKKKKKKKMFIKCV